MWHTGFASTLFNYVLTLHWTFFPIRRNLCIMPMAHHSYMKFSKSAFKLSSTWARLPVSHQQQFFDKHFEIVMKLYDEFSKSSRLWSETRWKKSVCIDLVSELCDFSLTKIYEKMRSSFFEVNLTEFLINFYLIWCLTNLMVHFGAKQMNLQYVLTITGV